MHRMRITPDGMCRQCYTEYKTARHIFDDCEPLTELKLQTKLIGHPGILVKVNKVPCINI